MRALNYKERNDLTWKFVILFVVTVCLTVFAIFFDFHLPKKISEEQRKKFKDYQQFAKNEKQIIQKMDTLSKQILSFGKTGKVAIIEGAQIQKQINFNSVSLTDSASVKITARLESIFLDFLNDKINNVKGDNDLQKLNDALKEKRDELEEVKDELEALKKCVSKTAECDC